MRHTLILAAFALSRLLALDLRPAAGQETAVHPPTYQVVWSFETPADGREHVWENVTWLAEAKQLVAIEKSFNLADGKPTGEGQFTLWQFDADGKVTRTVRIDRRPPAAYTTFGPHDVDGVFPLPGGELLVVGTIDAEQGLDFIRLDRDGQRVRSNALKEHHIFCNAVLKSEKSILVVGDEFAMEVDFEGKVAWRKKYRREKMMTLFQDAIIQPDGKEMVLVAKSGKWNEFGGGPADTWLVRCDSLGNRLDERIIPGHPFATTQCGGGNIAIFKGSKSIFEYAEQKAGPWITNLLVVGPDLRTLHDTEMDLLRIPSMVHVGSDRFMLAAGSVTKGRSFATVRCLEIRQYNLDGQVTRALDLPWNDDQKGWAFKLDTAASDTQIYLAITVDRTTGKPSAHHGVIQALSPSDN